LYFKFAFHDGKPQKDVFGVYFHFNASSLPCAARVEKESPALLQTVGAFAYAMQKARLAFS